MGALTIAFIGDNTSNAIFDVESFKQFLITALTPSPSGCGAVM